MDIKMPHKMSVTISHKLYLKLKAEHALKGQPIASYGVIGKLIESIEKQFKNINLDYKGE